MVEPAMAAVLSPQHSSQSPSPSPTTLSPQSLPSPNSNPPTLPPLLTSPSIKTPGVQRAASLQKHRLSTFSTRSNASNAALYGSRPQSVAFPQFHSSLGYALVRDFAYPPYHPLHYGPPPERASGVSTPASDAHRRLSDPAPSWGASRGEWSATPWSGTEQLPTTSFGDHDGPPWSEDEDLQSPVVTSSRHRKIKSNVVGFDNQRGRSTDRPGSFQGTNGDGSETYYVSDTNEAANGPGGEFITYPPTGQPASLGVPAGGARRDSHFATILPNRSYDSAALEDMSSSPESPQDVDDDIDIDESRYSRDYQFTIASPDEEMHGRAVALFDFAKENENELPLVEGQVILVSYRHGQGWLVALDPKTRETGLVPEEYVRLLRDIEGGLHGLMNGEGDDTLRSPIDSAEVKTPTQPEHHPDTPSAETHKREASGMGKNGEYYAPVVSSFSTSREDFEPWPHHLLGSQVSTPTTSSAFPRRPSEEHRDRKSGDVKFDEQEMQSPTDDLELEDANATPTTATQSKRPATTSTETSKPER